MTARQITDTILSLTESYRRLGSTNYEGPAEYADRKLTERKAGESKQRQFSSDVVGFIGLLLEGFLRHYDVSNALFEGYCAGMKRNHEDQMGLSFMAYLCIFRYNVVDFGADAVGPLIFHVSARTRIVEFILFMCDAGAVTAHATPFWRKHVQDEYIDDFLVPTCVTNAEALRAVILTPTERGDAFNMTNKSGSREGIGLGSRGSGGFSSDEGEYSGALADLADDAPLTRTAAGGATKQQRGGKQMNGTTNTTANAPKFTSPRPPKTQLPPAGVREMQHTIAEKRPKPVTYKPTDAELRVVEAARHGKKLSALDDAIRAENRAKEEAIPFVPFSANNRPSNMDRLLEEQRAREREEMAPLPPRPTVDEVRRNLNDINDKVEVKTTKAALKRELALVQKRREEEEAKFAQRLAALRDDTEFREWQAQGRQADEEDKMRLMQQRKLDTMIADEEARQTRIKQARLKQAESRVMKDEIGEKRERLRREHEEKQLELARQAEEQRQQLQQDVAEAVGTVQRAKKVASEEVKAQRQKNEVEMALQAELDRRRKGEMIAKIRQMQKESAEMRKEAILARQMANRVSNYGSEVEDGLELLHAPMDEMSLVDLKKLLQATSRERARLTEEKRQWINANRDAEKASVAQMEYLVMKHRDDIRQQKDAKREDKRQLANTAAAAAKVKEEQQILELQAKLAKRREERRMAEASVKEDERRRVVAAQLLMKDTKAVEKKKLEQMERAAENTVIAAQNARLRNRQVQRAISANEMGRREENLNSAQRKLQEARALSDQINQAKKVVNTVEASHDEMVRKALFAEVGKKW